MLIVNVGKSRKTWSDNDDEFKQLMLKEVPSKLHKLLPIFRFYTSTYSLKNLSAVFLLKYKIKSAYNPQNTVFLKLKILVLFFGGRLFFTITGDGDAKYALFYYHRMCTFNKTCIP